MLKANETGDKSDIDKAEKASSHAVSLSRSKTDGHSKAAMTFIDDRASEGILSRAIGHGQAAAEHLFGAENTMPDSKILRVRFR